MNLGDIDLHSVPCESLLRFEAPSGKADCNSDNHPQLQHSISRNSVAASNAELAQYEADYAADNESVTTAETVVHWSTPSSIPNRSRANSYSEATETPVNATTDINSHAIMNPMDLRMDELRMHLREAQASQRQIFDELDSAPPTPDIDDTPYIRYAIDVLTRDEDLNRSERPRTANSEDSYPVDRVIPDEGLGYVQSQGLGYARSARKVKGPAPVDIRPNSGR
jgi:hypothetical protein